MSFEFEFIATQADAVKIVEQEIAPASVKAFLVQALTAFKPTTYVSVKAVGHLYARDYIHSNADISVQELVLRLPRGPISSAPVE